MNKWEVDGWNREWGNTTRKPHKKLYFNVTAEDIANGKPRSLGGYCPIELAIRREWDLDVTMGLSCFIVSTYRRSNYTGEYWMYRGGEMDNEMYAWINNFDGRASNPVKPQPARFYIEVAEEFLDKVGIHVD